MNRSWLPMPRYKLRKNLILKYLRKQNLKNKSVLEIGYASGDILKICSHMGLDCYGYDFSNQAYCFALDMIKKEKIPNITLLKNEENIFSKKYDYIFMFEVLEHEEDDLQTLKKLKKSLKSNGYLLFSVPAHMGKWGKNDELSGHYRRYEKKELSEKLEIAGFEIEFFWNYAFPLSIILDPALHLFHGKRKDVKKLSKVEQSKKSGIARKSNALIRILSHDLILYPFYILQSFFLNTDLGSCYLVSARKK